jgi:hypothetical protein
MLHGIRMIPKQFSILLSTVDEEFEKIDDLPVAGWQMMILRWYDGSFQEIHTFTSQI